MNNNYIENPKIIILLATYNGEKYIREQLQSLQQQTCQNFLCFIHDDGSRDNTMSIVNEYCISDPNHFTIMEGTPCGGAKENFMFMLKNAPRAPYYMLCDQDDVWRKDKVEASLHAMREAEKSDEMVCVYSDVEVVDKNLNTICDSFMTFCELNPRPKDLKELIYVNRVTGCTVMMNYSLKEKCCTLENYSLIYMHDWWIALVAMSCGTLQYIDQPLVKYRQHEHNTLGIHKKRKTDKMRHIAKYITHPSREIKKRIEAERIPVNMACALDTIIEDTNPNKMFIGRVSAIGSYGKISRCFAYSKLGWFDPKNFWRVLWI